MRPMRFKTQFAGGRGGLKSKPTDSLSSDFSRDLKSQVYGILVMQLALTAWHIDYHTKFQLNITTVSWSDPCHCVASNFPALVLWTTRS